MKFLIIIDAQNDFITGALANPDAQQVIPKIADYVKQFDGIRIFTRDSHTSDYLETQEGKNLPIAHCIVGTDGWNICPELLNIANNLQKEGINCYAFDKPTFGYSAELTKYIRGFNQPISEIIVCGFVTDICVISNVLGLKEHFSEVKISVAENLCAGLTPEKHHAAIEVMKSCQVNII